MEIRVKPAGSAAISATLLALVCDEGKSLFRHKGMPFGKQLAAYLKRANDKEGSCDTFPVPGWTNGPGHLLFFHTKQVRHHPFDEQLKTIAARAVGLASKLGAKSITFLLDGADGTAAAPEIAEGCLLGAYSFTAYKSGKQPSLHDVRVELLVREEDEKPAGAAVGRRQTVCAGVDLCRDLVNEPPAGLDPKALARAATSIAKRTGLGAEVLDAARLKREGFEGILAVGRGSARKPCMIILRHRPRRKSCIHLALVGKAITFDTGGYCLKPQKDMWEMKGDMAGGAAVIGAMQVITALRPGFKITGIVPSAVNMVNERALLPGDVIRTKTGKTVHVDNTDAEGRLILMDALVRAKEEGATHIIDIATLTGSVVRALGTSVSGIMGNDQDLVEGIIGAGKSVGEEYWQLPLVDEYVEMLKSDVADIDNSGKSPNAGSITAALFLREFVGEGIKWAHLDIAGTSFINRQWKYFSPGSTGVGVRTFVEFVSRIEE